MNPRVLAALLLGAMLTGLRLAAALSPAAGTQEPLALIVAAKADRPQPKPAELALIFLRKRLYWADGTRIQPVNLPAGHPLRLSFSQRVLGGAPDSFDSYWNEQYFHGVRPPYVVPSTTAMLRFVADTPTAVGYLGACEALRVQSVHIIALIDTSGRMRAMTTPPRCTQPTTTR